MSFCRRLCCDPAVPLVVAATVIQIVVTFLRFLTTSRLRRNCRSLCPQANCRTRSGHWSCVQARPVHSQKARVRKYSCSARPQALAAVDISPAAPAIRPFHTSGFAGSLGAGPLFLVQLQILTRTLHVKRCEVKISNTIAGCGLQCNGTTRGVNLDLALH